MLTARISLLVFLLCNCWTYTTATKKWNDVGCYPATPPVEFIADCYAAARVATDAFRGPRNPVIPAILRWGDCLVVVQPAARIPGIESVSDGAMSGYMPLWQNVRAVASKILDTCWTKSDRILGPQLGLAATDIQKNDITYYYHVSLITAPKDMPRLVERWQLHGAFGGVYNVYEGSSLGNDLGAARGDGRNPSIRLPVLSGAYANNAHALASSTQNLSPPPVFANARRLPASLTANDIGTNGVYWNNPYPGSPPRYNAPGSLLYGSNAYMLPPPSHNAIAPGAPPSDIYVAGNRMHSQNAHMVPVLPQAGFPVYGPPPGLGPFSTFGSRGLLGNVQIAQRNRVRLVPPLYPSIQIVSGNAPGEPPSKRRKPDPGSPVSSGAGASEESARPHRIVSGRFSMPPGRDRRHSQRRQNKGTRVALPTSADLPDLY
ncbi:hypothetical protein MMC30_002449 [Trapelia coarctata]|nr:hypothetical protein [Trapelia coarctata]